MKRGKRRRISIIIALSFVAILFLAAFLFGSSWSGRAVYDIDKDQNFADAVLDVLVNAVSFRSEPHGYFEEGGIKSPSTPKPNTEPGYAVLTNCQGVCVPLKLEETAGVNRINEPVTSGVPLPNDASGVKDILNMRILRDIGGTLQEIPSQFTVLSRWDGPVSDTTKNIKWVIVHLAASVNANSISQNEYFLDFGPNVIYTQPQNPIIVDNSDPRYLKITTTDAVYEVDKERFNLLNRVWINKDNGPVPDDLIVTPGPDSGPVIEYVSDPANPNPAVYKANLGRPTEFVVEESGPLYAVVKVKGSFYDVSSNTVPYLYYIARLTVYRSSVKVDFILRNKGTYGGGTPTGPEPSQHVYFKRLDLNINVDLDQQKTVSFENDPNQGGIYSETFSTPNNYRLFQYFQDYNARSAFGSGRADEKFFYTVRKNGQALVQVGPAPQGSRRFGGISKGFMDVSDAIAGITIGAQYFWQNFPKAVSYDSLGGAEIMSLELWPRAGPDGGGFGPDRDVHGPHRGPFSGGNFYLVEGGRGKKTTVLLDFHGIRQGTASLELAKAFDRPLFAKAPGRWFASTNVFGPLVERRDWRDPANIDPNAAETAMLYERILCMFYNAKGFIFNNIRCGEDSQAEGISDYQSRGNDGGSQEFDWFNFGDFRWGDGRSSNHYDLFGSILYNFMRSDDYEALYIGRAFAQHRIDIDTVWSESGRYQGAQIYEKGQYHGDNELFTYSAASHSWIRGVLFNAVLTGDREAFESGRRFGERLFGLNIPANPPPIGSNSPFLREVGWGMQSLVEMYRTFGDIRYLNKAAGLVQQAFTNEQNSGGRGYLRQGQLNDPNQGYGSVRLWMQGMLSTGLARYHSEAQRATPNNPAVQQARDLLLRMANLYTDTGTGVPDCPNLQQSNLQNDIIMGGWTNQGTPPTYTPFAIRDYWRPIGYAYCYPPFPCNCELSMPHNSFLVEPLAYAYVLDPQQRYLNAARNLFRDRVRWFNHGTFASVDPNSRDRVTYRVTQFPSDLDKEWGWIADGGFLWLALESSIAQRRIPTPQITSIEPLFIPIELPSTVSINGNGFINNPPSEVLINGDLYTPSTILPERITVGIPANQLQYQNDVIVQNTGGRQSNTLQFFAVQSALIPRLDSIAPQVSTNLQSTTATIDGANFFDPRSGADVTLFVNRQRHTSYRIISPTQIEADFGAGDPPQTHVIEAAHGAIYSGRIFFYTIGQPRIDPITPQTLYNNIENTVTISGNNFVRNNPPLVASQIFRQSGNQWIPSGWSATVASERQMITTIQQGATPSNYILAVQNSVDGITLPDNLRSVQTFTINLLAPPQTPTISRVEPQRISVNAPTSLTIYGSNIINNPPGVTRVIVDGSNTPYPQNRVAINVAAQTVTVQIPVNDPTFLLGTHMIQLENSGASPPRSDPPVSITVVTAVCGNNIPEPGEQCDPPGSGTCPNLGEICRGNCQCGPEVPPNQIAIDQIFPNIMSNANPTPNPITTTVAVRGMNFPPQPEAVLLLNTIRYIMPYTVVNPFEIQVPIILPGTPNPPSLNTGFYRVQVGRQDPTGQIVMLSNEAPFTVIGKPAITLPTPHPIVVVNDRSQQITMRGANFVPSNSQHPAVVPSILFFQIPNPPSPPTGGRYSTTCPPPNPPCVTVTGTGAIEFTVPQLTLPRLYQFYVQNTVDGSSLPAELKSDELLDVIVVPPGCGNGVLEQGEECELNIPCTSGSCDIACRCVVPSPPSTGGGGGGSGGGGGGGSLGLIKLIDLDSKMEYAVDVVRGSTFFVKYNDREYSVRVESIKYSLAPSVTLKVQPRYELFDVGQGDELTLFLDSDSTADMKIKVIEITRNVHAKLIFRRLTQFSSRYLGPKPEPRAARRPTQVPTAIPVQYVPETESGTEFEPIYEEGEEFPYFTLVVKVLGGAVAILVILLLIYVLLSRREKGPITKEGQNE